MRLLTALAVLGAISSSISGGYCQSKDWKTFVEENQGPIVARDYKERIYFNLHVFDGADPHDIAKIHPDWKFEQPLGDGPLRNNYLFSVNRTSEHSELLPYLDNSHHVWGGGRDVQRRIKRRDDGDNNDNHVRLKKRLDSLGVKRVQVLETRQMKRKSPIPLLPQQLERRKNPPVDSSLLKIENVREQLDIQDPIFDQQWHLINPLQPGHDLNVTGLWMQDITGHNVAVAVVDDGLDLDHPDLKANYFKEGSWDFNDFGPDPRPRLEDDLHGTRCCGEIAAVKNDVCGVGVAYNSKIAGLRILSKLISEADEAAALNYAMDKNDIYSCSWGPPDDGASMAEPGLVVRRALINGVQNGRDKKGNVFVFASGNGAVFGDNCNFDGYTNSIYSITIAAIDRKDLHPYYSEACSANMVVTYSSNSQDKIHTTDVGNRGCTDAHGGTSAAAPIAAGVFALVLQVRPDLSWRDMQYLTIKAAVPVNVEEPGWQQTRFGKQFHHSYGYGKIDSYELVEAAKDWKVVKPQTWWFSKAKEVNEPINYIGVQPQQQQQQQQERSPVSSSYKNRLEHTEQPLTADKIDGAVDSIIEVTKDDVKRANLENVEHVNVMVNIGHQVRGSLTIDLISPDNIVSRLAAPRPQDLSTEGFSNWTFMSVAHWGESGVGKWRLRVLNDQRDSVKGTLFDWRLKLWGQAKDASKAVLYDIDKDETVLPEGPFELPAAPHPSATPSVSDVPQRPVPSHSTGKPEDKPSPKPEETQKPDEDKKPEEQQPTATSKPQQTAGASPSASPTNESSSWSLIPTFGLSKHTLIWVYGSILVIVIFIISLFGYIWLWRRRQRRAFKRIPSAPSYEFDVIGNVADEDGEEDDPFYSHDLSDIELQQAGDSDEDEGAHGEERSAGGIDGYRDDEQAGGAEGGKGRDEARESKTSLTAGKNARRLYEGEELFRVDSSDEEAEKP